MLWLSLTIVIVGFFWYAVKTQEHPAVKGVPAPAALRAAAQRAAALHEVGKRSDLEALHSHVAEKLALGLTDDALVILDGHWSRREYLRHEHEIISGVTLKLLRGQVSNATVATAGLMALVICTETSISEQVLAARIGLPFDEVKAGKRRMSMKPDSDGGVGEISRLADERKHEDLAERVERASTSGRATSSAITELAKGQESAETGPELHGAYKALSDAAWQFAVDTHVVNRWIADRHPGLSASEQEEWIAVSELEAASRNV